MREVRQLVVAQNTKIRQSCTADSLQRQPATLVYIPVSPRRHATATDIAVPVSWAATPARPRQRLPAAVE